MSKIVLASFLLRNNVYTNNIKILHRRLCSDFITNNPTLLHDNTFLPPKRLFCSKSLGNVQLKPNLYKDDSDTFGVLSGDSTLFDNRPADPGDLEEEKFISNPPSPSQILTTVQYADLIKNHLKYKRIKEALDVLQVRMLKEDRVKPEKYIYNLMISGCARAGYTKMAFKLYNDMKRRKIEPSEATFTSLFVSCSNAPWQHDGLERATYLRNSMKEKGIEPNLTNYHAMINAFGRSGDIRTAFEIVDEMRTKKIKIRTNTFNFLFQACISDKKTGFKHALLTWRKMLEKRQKPNIFTFNLMLRCAKDCGVGEEPLDFKTLLGSSLPSTDLLQSIEDSPLNAGKFEIEKGNDPQHKQISNIVKNVSIPNFLSLNPSVENVVTLNNPKSPEERFCMMGGLEGFLREAHLYKVKPNLKMMTQILTLLPGDLDSETTLMSLMDNLKIKYDIDFFNMLIKKRCLRFDYDSALMVKELIEKADKKERKKRLFKNKTVIKSDIITYGVLAMCCDTKTKAQDLINEMMTKKLRINAEIIGTLFRQATSKKNFDYVNFVIENINKHNIQVNDLFLEHLKKFTNTCNKMYKYMDVPTEIKEMSKEFLAKSNKLYEKLNQNKEILSTNPWVQYKENMNPCFQQNSNMNPRKRYYYKHRRIAPRYAVKV